MEFRRSALAPCDRDPLRVVTVAANALIERAFGKPREYDPIAEQAQQKPTFDPSLFTMEELEMLYKAAELMARRQGLLPEEAEDVPG